jgi:hypothetical protein
LTVTADTTLTKTTGSSLGSTSSQYAIIIASPASANITITAPAAIKSYISNNTSGTYSVKIVGAGPTTGVTLAVNEKAIVAWNGSDFVKISSSIVATGTVTSVGGTGTVNGITLTGTVTSSGNLTLGGTLSGVSLTSQVSGTLPVGNGGTGATTLAGANIPVINAANTFSATQTFNGTSSTFASVLLNAAETTTVSATAATGTINYYVNSQSVLYYTTNASANWTLNVAFSAGTSLNSALATGQKVTIAFMVTQGATAYYASAFTIDGTSVTPKWQGGTAPSSGNASSIDVYTYTITKTASATYTVLASQTKFA